VRTANPKYFRDSAELRSLGLTVEAIQVAINYVYEILDSIDAKLQAGGSERLAELLELANLSAIVGNLFRSGIVRGSSGRFRANAPHTYPDLVADHAECVDVEIKVALETNKPKGHLVKPGAHLTVRYVLASEAGELTRGKKNRGPVPWIWEVRAGHLAEDHFNFSNTEGDSGKTAVINAAGMDALQIVFCDLSICPSSPKGRSFARLSGLFD
jgi:hypothetical protein